MSLSPLERELLAACKGLTVEIARHVDLSRDQYAVFNQRTLDAYDKALCAIAKAEALAKPDLDGAETP